MEDQRVKEWKTRMKAVKDAIEWNNLPYGAKYQDDTFDLTTAHSEPPVLCRCGQQYCGGQNYWKTGESFNKAILQYIVEDWDNVFPKVLEILKGKEKDALLKLASYVKEMNDAIEKATKDPSAIVDAKGD